LNPSMDTVDPRSKPRAMSALAAWREEDADAIRQLLFGSLNPVRTENLIRRCLQMKFSVFVRKFLSVAGRD